MPRETRRRPLSPRPAETEDTPALGRRAFALALAKLSRRDHTSAELRRALSVKGYPEDAIEEALGKVTRLNLVDDLRYARRLAVQAARSGRRGPLRLIASLQQKGISTAMARAAAKEAYETSEQGAESLHRFAARLLERSRGRTLKERRIKVIRSLLGRGFSLPEARRALRIAENALMNENTANDADHED